MRVEILDTEAEPSSTTSRACRPHLWHTGVANTFVDATDSVQEQFGTDVTQVPREIGFCAHTILNRTVRKCDMLQDDRFVTILWLPQRRPSVSTPALL